MIKTESLRIGNWIKLIGSDEHHLVGSLQTKMVDNIGTIHLYGNGVWNREDQVEGIRITSEILDKCGFDLFDDDDFMQTQYRGIFYIRMIEHIRCTEIRIGDMHFGHIAYLHELQNIYYSITGQELNYTP